MVLLEARPHGVTLANWDLGGPPSAWAYLHAGDLLPAVEIAGSSPTVELEHVEIPAVSEFHVEPGVTLSQYLTQGPVSGLVAVLRGRIVFERYPRMHPHQRHLLMSVTKVFTSALIGVESGIVCKKGLKI